MLLKLFLVLLTFSFVLAKEQQEEKTEPSQSNAKDLSHGFGKDIDWVDWKQAISISMDLDKPIFLLIHKTWCGACKLLKKSFDTSVKRNELIELSQKFVMVNTEDDEEPEEKMYAPDGAYIPRLFFLNKKGEPLDVDNKKNYAKNAHYFPQLPDVIKAMKQALKAYAEDRILKHVTAEREEREGALESETEEKETEKKQENVKKTEKQPADKKAKKEDKTKDKKTKKEEASPSVCPHAAAAKAKAAKKEAEQKEKPDSKSREIQKQEFSKDKEVKKSNKKQTKKSEL